MLQHPLLVTWMNLTPSMNEFFHTHKEVWSEANFPFLNFHGGAAEVWGCLSNFITLYMMDVFTYQCWG